MARDLQHGYASKPEEFRYTPSEREAIMECLGEIRRLPTVEEWIAGLENLYIPPREEDDIIEDLESRAIELFNAVRSPSKTLETELREISKIGRLAKQLHTLLTKPNSRFGLGYQWAYLGLRGIGNRDTTGINLDRDFNVLTIMDDLSLIANGTETIAESYRIAHSNDFSNAHNPTFLSYIYDLINFWRIGKGQVPGGSKAGGPAAQFVMEVVNPVLRFAARELGMKLRRKGSGELTLESAGELIASVKNKAGYGKQSP